MLSINDLPKNYRNPRLMVVGDSLAQGCRSLTVKREFCEQSYGAVLAKSQGWEFTTPDHPRPVVIDAEDVIRKSGDPLTYLKLAGRIEKNISAWKEQFSSPSGNTLCFDNLAIAGCTTAQFLNHSASDWRGEFEKALAEYEKSDGFAKLGKAVSLHFPINGRYVLNPTGDAAFDGLSQLGWAFLRKPRNLIVHFGHNDGLYAVGSEAKVPVGGLLANKGAYLDTIKRVLAAPKDIAHLVIVLLPKVSCVANLRPEGGLLPGSAYYESYSTVFPFDDESISGADLAEMDRQIKEINGEARLMIGKAKEKRQITIIETYQTFAKYDFKNTGNPNAQIRIGSALPVDNRYLEGRRLPNPNPLGGPAHLPRWVFKQGGFQSIDGMHPSAIGYAVFADEIAREMNLPRDTDRVLRTALKHEKLVADFPSALPGFLNLLNVLKSVVDAVSRDEDTGDKEPAKSDGPAVAVGAIARRFSRG